MATREQAYQHALGRWMLGLQFAWRQLQEKETVSEE